LFLKGEYDARHYRKKRRLQPYHSADYSREELVAELGSAFLCADLELHQEPREDNAAYIAHWLEVLKNDNGVATFLLETSATKPNCCDQTETRAGATAREKQE